MKKRVLGAIVMVIEVRVNECGGDASSMLDEMMVMSVRKRRRRDPGGVYECLGG